MNRTTTSGVLLGINLALFLGAFLTEASIAFKVLLGVCIALQTVNLLISLRERSIDKRRAAFLAQFTDLE
ncbi:hypothetical protein nbrc107696_23480 [Gordonia spumicola]|uniref:Uncharacterized protein n=1 Tax=Gordonia spumicola TaxID=589161 RepID=A0A7I9V9I7_9ACTN|nr:hypothetical protein [Gordonia spumicola]GEE01902.1 hypothetical protein nbrc107696_23480 [Gordonia spumicola]